MMPFFVVPNCKKGFFEGDSHKNLVFLQINQAEKSFMMKKLLAIICITCTSWGGAAAQSFWLGADVSSTTELEAGGTKFRNAAGEVRENTMLMRELGLDAIRLRVWVDPSEHGGFCSPPDMLQMARRAKDCGMPLMIDFHYSDYWADPGQQNIPTAWEELTFPEMCEALADYTRSTLELLKQENIDVRWVQVGNETTNGFLWPMGHKNQMQQYAGLTKAGYEAVKQVYPEAQVIVHVDCAADIYRYHTIFDGLLNYGARWDIIGMSVYPYWDLRSGQTKTWQETVERFAVNARALFQKYHTPLMVVETGVERDKPAEGKQILTAILRAARYQTDGHCLGVFYWAPELESYRLSAFRDGCPTEIMDAFREYEQP